LRRGLRAAAGQLTQRLAEVAPGRHDDAFGKPELPPLVARAPGALSSAGGPARVWRQDPDGREVLGGSVRRAAGDSQHRGGNSGLRGQRQSYGGDGTGDGVPSGLPAHDLLLGSLTSYCPGDATGRQEWRHHSYCAASTTIDLMTACSSQDAGRQTALSRIRPADDGRRPQLAVLRNARRDGSGARRGGSLIVAKISSLSRVRTRAQNDVIRRALAPAFEAGEYTAGKHLEVLAREKKVQRPSRVRTRGLTKYRFSCRR
jgi:hypothetical protein